MSAAINTYRIKIPKSNREKVKAQIAAHISEFLEEGGHKVEWLAERSGIDRTTIWRILGCKVLPNEETLRSLASVVGIAPLVAAGYSVEAGNSGKAEAPIELSAIQIPDLNDPELGFYLSQIGSMPVKTQEIIKTILREEYRQLGDQEKIENASRLTQQNRPSFARKLSTPTEPSADNV